MSDGWIECAMPAGGVGGDVYLTWVSQQAPTDITGDPPMVNGFDYVAGSVGAPYRWDWFFQRVHDGGEPATIYVDQLADGDGSFVRVVSLLLRGCDLAQPLVYNMLTTFDGGVTIAPTVDIDAVTTTVDESLVLIGWETIDPSSDGPDVTVGTVDSQVVLIDANTLTIWSAEQVVAGTAGPWTIDRADETDSFTDIGGSWWTITAQSEVGNPLPTIEAHAEITGNGAGAAAPTAPTPVTITNIYPPYQSVTIGGTDQADQDAQVAAQRATWEAEYQASLDATADFLDFAEADIAANLAWLDANPDWDPQVVAITRQLTRLMQYVFDHP